MSAASLKVDCSGKVGVAAWDFDVPCWSCSLISSPPAIMDVILTHCWVPWYTIAIGNFVAHLLTLGHHSLT